MVLCLLAASCRDDRILGAETYRGYVPANARVLDDRDEDGSGFIQQGESVVIRRFEPLPPATAADVLAALVAQAEHQGWMVAVDDGRATGTKTVDGTTWTLVIAHEGDHVVQVFAGR